MKLLNTLLLVAVAGLCSCANTHKASDTAALTSPQTDTVINRTPTQATILFVGDAMQHQDQLDRAKQIGAGKYDYSECFELIAPAVQAADYAVVNLEVPLGGGKDGYTGFPCFSAPDSFAAALKDAGFDLFLTANNHTLDRSDYGLRRTLQVLDSLEVDHTGTFSDHTERTRLVPLIKEIKGIKVAFLNYTYGTNGLVAKDGAEVSLIDKQTIAREMQLARDKGAEITIVCMHWGVEYVLSENASQRDLADFLVSEGADLVIGSHPHVIQPMKVVHSDKHDKDCLVVYSLGNFISNMKTNDTRGGALVSCLIERDATGKASFKSATYDTFYSAKPDVAANSNFKVIPSWHEARIPQSQLAWWHTFNNTARRVFSASNIDVPAAR